MCVLFNALSYGQSGIEDIHQSSGRQSPIKNARFTTTHGILGYSLLRGCSGNTVEPHPQEEENSILRCGDGTDFAQSFSSRKVFQLRN